MREDLDSRVDVFMKKQAFNNGDVSGQSDDEFIKELEQTTSLVDFYKNKDKILEKLKKK